MCLMLVWVRCIVDSVFIVLVLIIIVVVFVNEFNLCLVIFRVIDIMEVLVVLMVVLECICLFIDSVCWVNLCSMWLIVWLDLVMV